MESNKRNLLDQSDELGDNLADSPAKKQRVAEDVDDVGSSVSQADTIAEAQLNEQVLSHLECPVCRDTCLPPIFMCSNGHIVCSEKCQPLLRECGTCRAPGKPTLRCVQLEKIAGLLTYPCPNKQNGCTLVLCCSEMLEHIPKCEYGLKCFLCPTWKGCGIDMKVHVQTMHPEKCHTVPPTGCCNRQTSMLKKKYFQNKTFYIVFFYNEDMFWVETSYSSATRSYSKTLRLATNDVEKASRYIYSIEFKANNSKNNFKVFFEGNVQTMNGTDGGLEIVLPAAIIDSYEGEKIDHTINISVKQ